MVSFNPGYFNDRLEVAGLLWKNGISADVMYESGLTGNEDQMALCDDEGVLYASEFFPSNPARLTSLSFMVYPRPRTTRRDQANFKIKSVLNKTEHEGKLHTIMSFFVIFA